MLPSNEFMIAIDPMLLFIPLDDAGAGSIEREAVVCSCGVSVVSAA